MSAAKAIPLASTTAPRTTVRFGFGGWPLPLLAALFAVSCYAGICSYLKPHLAGHSTRDFSCFYRAGKMLRIGEGRNIYNFAAEQRYDRLWSEDMVVSGQHLTSYYFVSAPFVLLVFAPLSYLSYAHAELAWFWLNVGMLLSVPLFLSNILGKRKLLAFVYFALPLFIPVVIALIEGQQSILLLFFFTLCFRALYRGHELLSGVWLALSSFKPQYVLPLFLVLLLTRRWRAVASFCATCFALLWVCVAMVGWHATVTFPAVLQQFNHVRGPAGIHPDIMINMRGLLYVLLSGRLSETFLQLLTVCASLLLVLVLALSFVRPKQPSLSLQFALAVAITLLASYHSYLHDASILVLPFLLVTGYLKRKAATLTRVALVLTMAAFVFVLFTSPSYQQIVFRLCFTSLVFVVLLFVELISGHSTPLQASILSTDSAGL